MANTIKVNFWLLRSKTNKENLTPLMLRLSYQGNRLDRSTGRYIDAKKWSSKRQRLKGHSEINEWIEISLSKVARAFNLAIQGNSKIYLPEIIDAAFAKPTEEKTLLELINEHNLYLKQRLGIDYTQSTYEKYVYTANKIKAFLNKRLNKKDILLKDLSPSFIFDFDHYLRVADRNMHNTAVKYCLNLKRIINNAVTQGLISNNPFKTHKTVYKDTKQVYLDEAELNKIVNLSLQKPAHNLVRDLFVFQCYTGLSYTDLSTLKCDEITTDQSGRKWIIKRRQKSGIQCTIPLLPSSQSILNSYTTDFDQSEVVFKTYTIQKYNFYLNEIGEIAKLNKRISSHVGRRTFGNIGLSKGLSLNVISKILGHSNTLITQRIYAITTQKIIENEIDRWQ